MTTLENPERTEDTIKGRKNAYRLIGNRFIKKYAKHLQHRLILRKIDHDLPRTIFEQSVEHYDDMETGHRIATMEADLYGKQRDVMVAGKQHERI